MMDITEWIYLFQFTQTKEYQSLNEAYHDEFGENLDIFEVLKTTTVEEYKKIVAEAVETGEAITPFYCPNCGRHDSGVKYTTNDQCRTCDFPRF